MMESNFENYYGYQGNLNREGALVEWPVVERQVKRMDQLNEEIARKEAILHQIRKGEKHKKGKKKKYKKMLAQMAERDFQMRCYMMKYMQYNTDQMRQLSDSFSYYVTPVQQVQQRPQRSQWMEQVDKWLPQVVGIVLTGITTYFAKKKESTWHK